jgi:hypothetical protein
VRTPPNDDLLLRERVGQGEAGDCGELGVEAIAERCRVHAPEGLERSCLPPAEGKGLIFSESSLLDRLFRTV